MLTSSKTRLFRRGLVTRGSLWIYAASLLYEWARSCGPGVVAGMSLLILGGSIRLQRGRIESVRLALAADWLALFTIFSVLYGRAAYSIQSRPTT